MSAAPKYPALMFAAPSLPCAAERAEATRDLRELARRAAPEWDQLPEVSDEELDALRARMARHRTIH